MVGFSTSVDVVEGLKLFEKDIRFCTCPNYHKKNLKNEMEDLKLHREVVNTKILEQERRKPRTGCKVEVKGWLARVNDTENEVNTLLDELKKISSCTCCFSCHNYGLGKDVVDLIKRVNSLVEDRRKFNDDNLVSYDPIDNIPDLSTAMVGREGKSKEIQDYLKVNSQVTTIGIWGMGGIGKTTMLMSIKHWLDSNDYHYIIWIKFEMSQNDDDILKIQKQIAECISLPLPSEHEETENAKYLHEALQKRKSLVLIDNVWNKLDFVRIGIPFAVGTNTFVKILFTTRSKRVCHGMGAKIVRLDSLDEKESLQLFQGNISTNVDPTDMIVSQRVDEILSRCGGIPLVIVTVAKTVAYYTQYEQWDDAVKRPLRSYEGMDDVIDCLKFSYDKAGNLRRRLLYLSLYREGAEIYRDEIIKEWVAEGFLDTPNDNSFTKSYIGEVDEIDKLESICLVEKSVYSDDCVKLHDVIRHMLCRIREQENKEEFIVYNDQISYCNYDRWRLAKRICLLEGQLKGLPGNGMPSCPNLTSLLVEYEDYPNRIDKLPTEDFFNHTSFLRVLNLRFTGLVDIPKSIGELVELRYLNLYRTRIRTLPMELANLKKLMYLDLGDTFQLATIVGSAISQLSALQSLNLFNTSYQWKSDDVNTTTQQHPLLKLEDLRELKNLEDLGVDVRSKSHLDTILCAEMFLESIARISFIGIDFTTIDLKGLQPIEWISKRLPKLKDLIVDRCTYCTLGTDILEIKDDQLQYVTQLCLRRLEISSVTLNLKSESRPFSRLKTLEIFGCQRLKEVSWTARIPSLEQLIVDKCNSVKELVEIREERDYFPKLFRLKIKDLANLERIHGRSPLLFPALRRLVIENCPKLKQLSFGDDSAKNMEFINCEKIQWDSLKWENDQVQAKFSPYVRHSLQ